VPFRHQFKLTAKGQGYDIEIAIIIYTEKGVYDEDDYQLLLESLHERAKEVADAAKLDPSTLDPNEERNVEVSDAEQRAAPEGNRFRSNDREYSLDAGKLRRV